MKYMRIGPNGIHVSILNCSDFAYRRIFFVLHLTGGADKIIKSKDVLCYSKEQIQMVSPKEIVAKQLAYILHVGD